MFVIIVCAMYVGTIFLFTRFLYPPPLRKSALPTERWTDIFPYINRNQLEKTRLTCYTFDRLLANKVQLPRRRLCSVSMDPSMIKVREVSVSGAKRKIVAKRIPPWDVHGNASISATIFSAVLGVVDQSLVANFVVSSVILELTLTDQFIDALLDSFPRLRDTSELIIRNGGDAPIPLEILRKLCARLPQLQHLEIGDFPAVFNWSILQKRWFLSIPKFSLCFGEGPVVPDDEALIMQYLFDFSNLPESATKYADLGLIRVTNDFLRRLVERIVKTEDRLTVCLHTFTDNAKPIPLELLEKLTGFEETVCDNNGSTTFRYDHRATRATFISQPWNFFITNVPDENANRHGQPQDAVDLRLAYGEAFRRGDTILSESFESRDPPRRAAKTVATEAASPTSAGTITCETSYQQKVHVDIEVLRLSHTFDDMYGSLNLAEEDNFPGVFSVDVDASIFEKVIDWCIAHKGQPEPMLEQDPDTRERQWFIFNAYERKFFDVPVEELEQLVEAGSYLEIKSLYHYGCQAIAAMIRDKSPEQIRALFGFEDDLTEEEKDAIRAQNPWCKY